MKYSFIIILGLFVISCNKDSETRCFKSTGRVITQTYPLESFTHLSVYDKYNVFIVTDTFNQLQIEAGENLIDGIDFEIIDDTLKIKNINKCNWLRSYKIPINLYVTSNTLRRIFVNGYCKVETKNTFKANYLYVEGISPLSEMKFDVDVNTLYFSAVYTTGDFTLTGSTDSLRIFNQGTGYVFAQNLQSKRCWVVNGSTGDCHVKVSKRMHVEIHNTGDIYYYQEPEEIDIINISSSGKLIYH